MTATAKEGRNVGGLNNHVNVLMLVLSSLKFVYFCRFYGSVCPQQSTKAPLLPSGLLRVCDIKYSHAGIHGNCLGSLPIEDFDE